MPDIKLPILRSVSPSLAELLRSCKLRAGLSYAEEAQAYTIGNPKAWLGEAYHRVMARAPWILNAENAEDLDRRFEQKWADSIRDIAGAAMENDTNARFGSPSTWPGYFVVRAMARQRIKSLPTERRHGADQAAPALQRSARERRYSAADGKLVGRVDLVEGDKVIDFKSGEMFIDSGSPDPTVREAYARQLRLYGYLVAGSTGTWPRRGRLIPPYGPSVAIDLDEGACTREAQDAIRLLDDYNDAIGDSAVADVLAAPSPEHCRWCNYKLICPAFWQSVDSGWRGQLEGEALEGELLGNPMPLRGGQAVALDVSVNAGSLEAKHAVISPLLISQHESMSMVRAGECVRLTSLVLRQNGSICSSKWTQCIRADEVPAISSPR